MARLNRNNTKTTEQPTTIEKGYKIGVIKIKGGVKSYMAIDEDSMEMKVLEIMEKENYKKIFVLNKKTKERKVYLPE